MFALQDHLPLDRIITRFSAPTTITQFQRSSLDGILIELARLVTHGANDNIFCLSGLIESAGGEGEVLTVQGRPWFWCISPLSSRSLSFCCSVPSRSATIHALKITVLAHQSRLMLYCVTHSEPLFHASGHVSLGHCKRDVWLGGKRVSINASREQTPYQPLKYIPIRMINDAGEVMKGRETEEGSYHAAARREGFSPLGNL